MFCTSNKKKPIKRALDWNYNPYKEEDEVFDQPLDSNLSNLVNKEKF